MLLSKIDELVSYCCEKTVVLVGNAQATTSGGKGNLIDSYDIVVRMNHGFVRPKLTQHMGSKTSIWACSFNSQSKQLDEFKNHWFQADFIVRFGKTSSLHAEIRENSSVFTFENTRRNKFYRELTVAVGARPSTGIMIAYLFFEKIKAQSKCDVFGYDHFATANRTLRSRRPKGSSRRHIPELEKLYLDNLLKEKGGKRLA